MSRLRIRLRDHVRQKTNADKAAKKNNQPLSSKAKMKLYRERLKGNPALYKAYRESEAARSRLYRASLSDRKKADQREKTRIRVQKWREKQKVKLGQKNEATVSKPKNSVKTREQKKTQQEKWRLSKQKQRANMTGQKKRRINEKRRAKYHEKKQIAITKKEMTSNTESKGLEDDGYKTTDSKRKAVYRAKQNQIEKNKAFGDPEPINEDKLILQCCNFNDLTKAVKKITIEDLPSVSAKNFCNTGCTVDNDSLPIVPEDIPLKPNSQLYPCTIYGDGNCLPRSASLLAYGSEDNFKEMRRRMVIELTRNEKYYLDKTMMENGKQYNAQNDVPKTFAHFSNMFQGQKLTSNNVKTIFEKEVLEIRKSGAYMGLWQIACLANILKCPVVSVVPTYGTNTVREDMHRAFYPFIEEFHSNQPVFIMWTRLGGVQNLEEKDFTLNHFDVLMPLTDTGSIDTDLDEYVMDESFDLNDTAGSSILNIITNFMTNELTTENDVPENLITAFSTDELHGNDISVPPAPDNGNTQFSYATDTTICENNVMVNQQLQTEEPRSIGSEDNSRQMEATGHTRDLTEGQDLDADTGGDTVQAVSQEKRSILSEDNNGQVEAAGHTSDLTEGQDLDADTEGDTVQAVSQENRCLGSEDNSGQMEAEGHTSDWTERQDLDADTEGDTVQAVTEEKRWTTALGSSSLLLQRKKAFGL